MKMLCEHRLFRQFRRVGRMAGLNFQSMNKLILVTAFLLLAGCAGTYRQPELDRAAVVQLAKDELGRRGLDLPRFYEVEFENGEIGDEIGPPRPIYSVSFFFVYRGHKRAVYTVFIDKRSHKVDQVSDYRATVPSGV
jgi:hypothetical protein